MGGDPTDDMMADLGMDDEEGDEDEGEEGEMEDRVEDLEDALEDLKAEFEKMMAGDDEGDDEGEEEPEEEAFAYEATDEEVDEATDEEVEESDEEVEEATDEEVEESKAPQTAGEQMREYVEKVTATMGDNGANTKSAVASANDMGGDAGNIAQGADEKGRKADSAKEDSAGNVNVPGGKASKSMKSQPGHGAEKKGKPETADNKKPTIGG
jgi:midasin